MKVMEMENKLKNFHTVKGKSYSENYVNYLLNLLVQDDSKKVEIPKDMKVKIERFRASGGNNTLELTKKNIMDNGFNCGNLIEEIKNLLAREKSEDDEARKKYPSKWTRAYSEQSNQEYVYRLRELEQKFFIAQNTDKEIFKKYDQNSDWMKKFSMSDDEIIQLLPQNNDKDFVAAHKDALIKLTNLDKELTNIVDHDTQKVVIKKAFENFFAKADYISILVDINSGKAKKDEQFENIMEPLRKELDNVEMNITQGYPILDQITSLAKQINSKRSDNGQNSVKALEDMSLAITNINGIYSDMNLGANFYFNLNYHLENMQRVINDYVIAREIEKNALIQDLEAESNYKQMNVQNAYFINNQFPEGKAFYVDNKFPDGKSEFVVNYKPPTQQQNISNPYNNVQNFQQQNLQQQQQQQQFLQQQQQQQQKLLEQQKQQALLQ